MNDAVSFFGRFICFHVNHTPIKVRKTPGMPTPTAILSELLELLLFVDVAVDTTDAAAAGVEFTVTI